MRVRFPTAFLEIAGSHRRVFLHRFPYAVYYRVDQDVIDVLACLHDARAPETWWSSRATSSRWATSLDTRLVFRHEIGWASQRGKALAKRVPDGA